MTLSSGKLCLDNEQKITRGGTNSSTGRNKKRIQKFGGTLSWKEATGKTEKGMGG